MSAGTGGVATTVSSARPEDLQQYRDDVVRREGLVERSRRHVEQAAAAYAASCAEVPVSTSFLRTLVAPLGQLRALAARVADVGDAFLLADANPTGGLARTTDGAMARIVVDRYPALANATLLGSLADDLAEQVAEGIERAAAEGGNGFDRVRASVPPALASDPTFARAVLELVDADRLSTTVELLARRALPGRPTVDLSWLGDLFALGAANVDGRPTTATRGLLADAEGRTAVRILRASSGAHLPAVTAEAIARATAILHSSRTDGGHLFLVDDHSRDTGDDAILLDAARHPALALRLLIGEDPERPITGRIEQLAARSAGGSQVGIAALLAAARRAPQRYAPQGGLSRSGLALLHGTVAALAARPRPGLLSIPPQPQLVRAATGVVLDNVELATSHARGSDSGTTSRALADELTQALEHAARDERAWAALLEQVSRRRLAAMSTAIATGDTDDLDLVGRFDGLLTRAAERADAPDRRLDPVLDAAADAGGDYLEGRYGPLAGGAASAAVQASAHWAGDELAGDPGTARERLEAGGSAHADRVLAVVDALPGEVVWAGSGVGSRAELVAAARETGGEAVLEQWELAQGPEVHAELDRLRRRYRSAFEAAS